MAKKAGITQSVKTLNKKPTVSEQLATLKATISEYFSHLKYRSPEYSIKLAASIAGENGAQKVHMANVPSLIAAVITAQGLGKEVRVRAVQDPTGGALEFLFYSPVNIDGQRNLLS
jgi:hypothetical protein